MATSRPLHIGWFLDVPGVAPPGVPMTLRGSGLKTHAVLIAQSGAGKSFALGRLIEEILCNTRARVLVLDPNSDFVKFSDINVAAWTDPNLKPWFGAGDTQDAFSARWSRISFRVLTNRDAIGLGLSHATSAALPISISWGNLTQAEQATYLGLTMVQHHHELYALDSAVDWANQIFRRTDDDEPYSLQDFINVAGAIWARAGSLDPAGVPEDWPVKRIEATDVSADAAFTLYSRAVDLIERFLFWDRGDVAVSVDRQLSCLSDKQSAIRFVCVDIGSLASHEEQLLVTAGALKALWNSARALWLEAISRPGEEDERTPVFVVIDEAHNVAPANPTSEAVRAASEAIQRIATEGRKYGLFLILVSQRPGRLNETVISQCDNLCLLKTNNRHDLELLQRLFGFLPPGAAKRARTFQMGEAVFSGRWVDKTAFCHVAPRRTDEGGRNIRDEFWLQEP